MACPHGELSPSCCLACINGEPAAPPPRPRTYVEHRFPVAQFDGHCRGCNTAIHVGQPIARLSTGDYVHDSPGCLP